MIQEAFFDSLLTYMKSESLLERYAQARDARGTLTPYDQRALEAERVRNLAILSHAWNRAVGASTPVEI